MDTIDLRSDTVTWPTDSMRQAMANAVVGDDVYGEDPTVNALEKRAAEIFGKEAALFVPSGTMGNLVSILTHCGRGDEAILGDKAHTFMYEVGSLAAMGGIHPHTIPVQADGTFALDDIRNAIRDPENDHYPLSRLITLENAQCGVGGIPLPIPYLRQVRALVDDYGLVVHVDGARIFNAAVALDCSVADLAADADSVSCCLSKGLCAPTGAIIAGDADYIRKARRTRKAFGGGMRQAGILAAAGLVAFDEIVPRLADDHKTAKQLAEGLATISGLDVNPDAVHINMLFMQTSQDCPMTAEAITAALKEKGIRVGGYGQRNFRLVTHYWITPDDVEFVVQAFKDVLS